MVETAGCVSGLIQAGPSPEQDQQKPGPYVGLIVGGGGGGHRSHPRLWGGVQTNTGWGPMSTGILHRGRPSFLPQGFINGSLPMTIEACLL